MALSNTNAITNITDESQFYVYPMAASLRGGAIASEYNIRNLMTCLFNKSAAKSDTDFILYYNQLVNGKRPTLETYYNNSTWYSMNDSHTICTIKDLAVGPGEGNCNGYYTRIYDYIPLNSANLDISDLNDRIEYRAVALSEYLPDIKYLYNAHGELLSGDISEDAFNSDDCVEFALDSTTAANKYFRKINDSNFEQLSLASIETSIFLKTEELYVPSTVTQEFNILLGLNWTMNQLVSSVQVTICDNTSVIHTITSADADGDLDTNYYTEFQLINKTLQDQGLLDAGIVLGKIIVKRIPQYNNRSDSSYYDYTYTCTYEGNRYKVACIDLEKLGSSISNIGDDLYDKLLRLYTLMIDSGSFKIGTVITNSGFNTNPQSSHHNFTTGISKYRLELGIEPCELELTDNVDGYLRIIDYDELNGSTSNLAELNQTTGLMEDLGYLFKCNIEIDRRDSRPKKLNYLTLFNDSIQICNEIVNFAKPITAEAYLIDKNDSDSMFLLGLGTNSIDNSHTQIYSNKDDSDGLVTYTINIIADTIKLDSIVTQCTGNLSVTENITANTITGNKVYGAVWM